LSPVAARIVAAFRKLFPAGCRAWTAGSLARIMVPFGSWAIDLLGRWFDESRRRRIARLVRAEGYDI
jgi:hypothetical protein